MSNVYDELKLFEYVASVSKQDIDIVTSKKPYHFDKVKKVVLSPLFFRKDGCECCGKCCNNYMINMTNEWKKRVELSKEEDFTKWNLDYKIIDEVDKLLIHDIITVNNKKVDFYSIPPLDNSPIGASGFKMGRCRFALERDNHFYCKLHPIKPFAGAIPHIVFRNRNQTTHIRKQQYGRNWHLGCPIKFGEFDYDKYKENDLSMLIELEEIAKDMGIETYINDIMLYLDSIDNRLKNNIVPDKNIVFKLEGGLFE